MFFHQKHRQGTFRQNPRRKANSDSRSFDPREEEEMGFKAEQQRNRNDCSLFVGLQSGVGDPADKC